MPEKRPMRTTTDLLALDYYARLGLEDHHEASLDDIKKAYKKMALRYHPDRNPPADCKDVFSLIGEAYEILSDPIKRSAYDANGCKKMDNQAASSNVSSEDDFAHFMNMFDNMSGFFGKPVKYQDVPEYMQFIKQYQTLQDMVSTAREAYKIGPQQKEDLNNALNESIRVVDEIHQWNEKFKASKVKIKKLSPTLEQHLFILTTVDEEITLNQLAEICSRVTHGLNFILLDKKSFTADIFHATASRSEAIEQVNYDAEAHKAGMIRLDSMASSLKGSGWKGLRKALLVLAAVMLVAAGILAAIPTGGVSLIVALGGISVATAGTGFFVGRDTGLAGAVRGVKMTGTEKPEGAASPDKDGAADHRPK